MANEHRKRVSCRLCNCEGVKGTVLCNEHLEGFQYAVALLNGTNAREAKLIAEDLVRAIEQVKGKDNVNT